MFEAMEAEARELTMKAYRRRQRGRLFRVPDIDATDRAIWPKLDELYWGKAVGVMAPFGAEHIFEWRAAVAVGVWHGIGRGAFGDMDLHLTHFCGPGSVLHRAPGNIAFVHVLPAAFQVIPEGWRREDEDSTYHHCYCEYVYKEGEEPCSCHLMCGGCCLSHEQQERMAA